MIEEYICKIQFWDLEWLLLSFIFIIWAIFLINFIIFFVKFNKLKKIKINKIFYELQNLNKLGFK